MQRTPAQPERRSRIHELDVDIEVVAFLTIPGKRHLLAVWRESRVDLRPGITGERNGDRYWMRSRMQEPKSNCVTKISWVAAPDKIQI
jgi:hypothetical protein